MAIFSSTKKHANDGESSAFSVFIREAKSREKKRVYKEVIDAAIEAQNAVIEGAGVVEKKSD